MNNALKHHFGSRPRATNTITSQTVLNEFCDKPLNAADIVEINQARQEVARMRQMCNFYRNQHLQPVPLDTTGDGLANARGYDTTGDGLVDSIDTTGDGYTDTKMQAQIVAQPQAVVIQQQQQMAAAQQQQQQMAAAQQQQQQMAAAQQQQQQMAAAQQQQPPQAGGSGAGTVVAAGIAGAAIGGGVAYMATDANAAADVASALGSAGGAIGDVAGDAGAVLGDVAGDAGAAIAEGAGDALGAIAGVAGEAAGAIKGLLGF